MTCLQITYSDHQIGHFPIDPEQGWRIDSALRMVVVGRGVPRTLIPLDNVQTITIVDRSTRPADRTARTGTATDAIFGNDTIRGEAPSIKASRLDQCSHGHRYTPENTYIHPIKGHRSCRTCHAADERARKARLRTERSGAA